MCDTIVVFGNEKSFFAKNSDRDPAERQITYISKNAVSDFYDNPFAEKKEKYIKNSFALLKDIFSNYDNNYKAVISKPVWIWGAEMGVNEFGLSIGNEAVFSKKNISNNALLGMDILRLALHNCKNADQAVEFIINLVKDYGQGGDGGYNSSFKYDNSFLIKDFDKAYVLEFAAKHWALKEVKDFKAISNSYSIENNYQKCDEDSNGVDNFKEEYENKLKTYFSKGNYRSNFANNYLKENAFNLSSMIGLLRSHISKDNKFKKGMKSICMHGGWGLNSETTASMVVEYFTDDFIVWFTASPNPCVSLYKPLILDFNSEGILNSFSDKYFSLKFADDWRELSHRLMDDWGYFSRTISVLRNKKEKELKEIMHKAMLEKGDLESACNKALNKAENFRKDLYKLW